MTNKSEWQEANRQAMAEQRENLGAPPTAEEMLAYSRGEMSETEEERIRDLLVAYPEVARIYGAPFPEDGDAVSEEELQAGWTALQSRMGGARGPVTKAPVARVEVPHRRFALRRYMPTSIAAALALLFFGLFVQAESRARDHERASRLPRVLGAPQELEPGGARGAGAPTTLHKDGEAYLLKPRLINAIRHPHYQLELHDSAGSVVWTNKSAQPDEDDAFQIVIPHDFLRPGRTYQLQVFGVDGGTRAAVASYDLAVPVE